MTDFDWYTHSENEFDPEELQNYIEELENIPDLLPDENGAIFCPVLPLRDLIIFPHMVAPLQIGRRSTLIAVEEAHTQTQSMIAIPQRNIKHHNPKPSDFFSVGVEVVVSDIFPSANAEENIVVQGRRRLIIDAFENSGPVLFARGRVVEETLQPDARQDALIRHLIRALDRFAELSGHIPDEALDFLHSINEPGWLADMVANSFPVSLEDRQKLFTNLNPTERLEQSLNLLKREVQVLEIEQELDNKVQDEVDRGQRENYLREQMKVIQQELGETDPWTRELRQLHKKIKSADLPEEIKTAALKEFERLYQMPPMSPEVGVIRTYLDWILDLPWNEQTEDNLDVNHAAEVLDSNHFALEKAKDRILEYIAVKSLKPDQSRQPILCFVGPPGTGKTSLGKSIAQALGRKFVRLSLGGVRDEAEMRGHRRTYIGALPGRILQTMKRAETTNPLFILDEVDKLGIGYRGDPAAALLEVLDYEQNDTFSDHYLELPYDLSNVLFITTANVQDEIPWALQDRMEMIYFPGYIEEEKLEIANQFLIKQQTTESGLEEGEMVFSEQAIRHIISAYTYEAGVRNLEREIGSVCRKAARLKAEGKKYPTRITPNIVEKFLGPPKNLNPEMEEQDEVGVATGLAWTSGGGSIMPVEVVLVDGKGHLQLTGQLGEVMQESGLAAMSYLKSHAKKLGIKPERFEATDVHVHIPEGAIPKDGPSAGITIATAIISAFTGRTVRRDVGMTGEITLRGRVLPVGGVRNKVLAAHRVGIKTIILPEKSEKDLVDVPKKALAELKIIKVNHMDEVLKIALIPKRKPAPKKKSPAKKPPARDTAPPPPTSG